MKQLIIVEGIDGAGKSTLLEQLKETLTERGKTVKVRRFPETVPPHTIHADPREACLFYLRDFFAQLKDGFTEDVLLCDRSFYTTLVYQGESVLLSELIWDTGAKLFFGSDFDTTVLHLCAPIPVAAARVREGGRREDKESLLTDEELLVRLQDLQAAFDFVLGKTGQQLGKQELKARGVTRAPKIIKLRPPPSQTPDALCLEVLSKHFKTL